MKKRIQLSELLANLFTKSDNHIPNKLPQEEVTAAVIDDNANDNHTKPLAAKEADVLYFNVCGFGKCVEVSLHLL